MVVAARDQQQPKKSKLSLFRLGKASTKPTSASSSHTSTSYASQIQPRAYTAEEHSAHAHSTQQGVPRSSSTDRIVRAAARDAESQRANAPIAVHYQFPESTNLARNYHWSSSPDEHHHYSQDESQYQRARADSLPLQSFVHPTEQAFAEPERNGRPNVPALARIQTQAALSSKHSRQRSHFSIPDVVVTTCEEEGQEQVVELEIPPNKRRSYVLCANSEERLLEQRSNKKSTSAFVRRPAPLIRFDAEDMKSMGMARSGSVPSISSLGSLASLAEITAASPSTPTSSASSSLSKGSTAKRNRKPSFPLLFGRKASDSSKSNAASQIYVEEPLPCSPTTPTSAPHICSNSFRTAQPDGLIFSSLTASMPANPPPSRNILTRAISGLPSPPVTPTSPPRSGALRKQMKAKAKEELALIKELERVDKLVKQHDDKARKAQEKVEAKNRKRAAKLAQINQEFERSSLDTRPSVDTFSSGRSQPMPASRTSNRTIFKASTKASATTGVGRKASIRGGTAEARAVSGERRGSEPILSDSSTSPTESRANGASPFSMDPPASERLAFTNPRVAPQPNVASVVHERTAPLSLTKQMDGRPSLSKDTSPPRPTRPAPPVPMQIQQQEPQTEYKVEFNMAEADNSISEDTDETHVWNRQSFSELSSGFTGPLPSLIQSNAGNTAVAPTAIEPSSEHGQDNQMINVNIGHKAKLARRASVQRVLALSDADRARLQKQASLRRKTSQQQLKRRSCHMDGIEAVGGAYSSKRSSASSARRRSFIRPVADDEGWKVISDNDVSKHDESAPWDDWIEDIPQKQTPPSPQGVEVQVDQVLADLRAAQDADHLRKHFCSQNDRTANDNNSNPTLTAAVGDDDDKETHELKKKEVLGKTVQVEGGEDRSSFRLSLALTPIQLPQPLDVFSDLEQRF